MGSGAVASIARVMTPTSEAGLATLAIVSLGPPAGEAAAEPPAPRAIQPIRAAACSAASPIRKGNSETRERVEPSTVMQPAYGSALGDLHSEKPGFAMGCDPNRCRTGVTWANPSSHNGPRAAESGSMRTIVTFNSPPSRRVINALGPAYSRVDRGTARMAGPAAGTSHQIEMSQ